MFLAGGVQLTRSRLADFHRRIEMAFFVAPGAAMSRATLDDIDIEQEIGQLASETPKPERVAHPIVLMARAYGFDDRR